jgi:hypothetical protein
MSRRTRAAIFIALSLAWWGLAAVSLAAGNGWVAAIQFVAGAATAAFAYRMTHPRKPAKGGPPDGRRSGVKELRAPRPPR